MLEVEQTVKSIIIEHKDNIPEKMNSLILILALIANTEYHNCMEHQNYTKGEIIKDNGA